jgi:hypothetical protein
MPRSRYTFIHLLFHRRIHAHIAHMHIQLPVTHTYIYTHRHTCRSDALFVNSISSSLRAACICHVYVCTYVCVHICLYAHMYVCTYACMPICKYAHMCVRTYACMCICTHISMYTRILSLHMHIPHASALEKSENVRLQKSTCTYTYTPVQT